MKILGIILLFVGAIRSVKLYTAYLHKQLEVLCDWEKIFRCWKDWMVRFSFSVDELIRYTAQDIATSSLTSAQQMENENIRQLIDRLNCESVLPKDELEIIIVTLREIGNSLTENELEGLNRSICSLQEKITEREKTVKERTALLYKLIPLLCGALAVVLW